MVDLYFLFLSEIVLTSLYEQYGYIATFLGTMLEGEISLLTSVLGAKMGYYNYYIALTVAFLGAWVADWFKYLVGKTKGKKILENKPKLKAKFDKTTVWFEKYPYWTLTFYKLFFGMTTIILLVAGLKNISILRFAFHSAISVALWVGILGGFGYFCAQEIIMKIEYAGMHKVEILVILFSVAFLYWFFVKRPYQKACMDCP
jgi:membrane protein DedA with SNARE-associated domain